MMCTSSGKSTNTTQSEHTDNHVITAVRCRKGTQTITLSLRSDVVEPGNIHEILSLMSGVRITSPCALTAQSFG
jgi:hypothetical protein